MEKKLSNQVYNKVSQKISLKPIADFKDLEVLKSLDGRNVGSFKAWTGDKIGKFSLTEINVAPGMNYTNISVKPLSKFNIPTLGANHMLMPEIIQFDVDLYPAVDLVTHQEYIDKYYEQLKDIFHEFKNSQDFKWKPSDHSWMRARTSPYFFMSATSRTNFDKVGSLILAYLELWLKIWESEKEVSPQKAEEIACRKKCMIEVLLEKEPERHILEKIFGREYTVKIADAMTLD